MRYETYFISRKSFSGNFIVTAAKVAFDFHVINNPFFVGENEIMHSSSPCCPLYHLDKETMNVLQEPPRMLMLCCPYGRFHEH